MTTKTAIPAELLDQLLSNYATHVPLFPIGNYRPGAFGIEARPAP